MGYGAGAGTNAGADVIVYPSIVGLIYRGCTDADATMRFSLLQGLI